MMDKIESKMTAELFFLITRWMERLQDRGLTPEEGHDTMVKILDQQKEIIASSFQEAKLQFEDMFG